MAARRPALVLAATAILALAALVLALRLEPDAGIDTLVGTHSPSHAATDRLRERFGDDAIVVLVRGDLQKLVLSQDIERLLALEGCIAGNLPRGATPPGGRGGPCGRLVRARPAKVVLGPGTFVNTAVRELRAGYERNVLRARILADAADATATNRARRDGVGRAAAARRGMRARRAVQQRFARELVALATRYGLTDVPQLDDPAFVSALVFDPTKPPGTPKRRFAYVFPNAGTAVVQVRLRAGLGERRRADAIALVRAAAAMPELAPRNGATYTVTGPPVVASDLAARLGSSLRTLLGVALLVMAGTLLLAFRRRPRLLPLALALVAAALTFGVLAVAGAPLTVAQVAVLPVLIGLAVDYAIQLQSRIAEEADAPLGVAAAARRAALLGAPAIAVAAGATAAGFAALALSPVPMVRGFGLLLVAGIAIAFVVALLAGTAALVAAERRSPTGAPARRAQRPAGAIAGRWARLRPAGDIAARAASATLSLATRRPARLLAVALVLAAAGWALESQTRVESDIQRLVPSDMAALRGLDALQRATGVGGQIDVLVEGESLVRRDVLAWMTATQSAILGDHGFGARRGCGQADLCPAFSLGDLFTTDAARADAGALLDALPPYLSRSVITSDRRAATLAFGLRLMPLAEQERVVDAIRARLDRDPPPGARATLAGLPVLAADANAEIASSPRRLLVLLAGLLAVAIVLLAAFREPRRALVPLVPIVLATGWSALLVLCLRIPLNPMSVTLGALVVAIATEFSVLLSERYREERGRGIGPQEALRRTYRSTGAAVLASGVTAIAGFAVLLVSDIRMLRDFGAVAVVDLAVALAGVLVVLPAALRLSEPAA